jgi:hypothetical protein
MTGLAKANSNCVPQARPLVKEDAARRQTRNRLAVITIRPRALNGILKKRETDRLAVGCGVNLALALT